MRVLVACEESQRVTIAFRRRGHNAFSCDIKECSGGCPEYHIKGDVLKVLNGNCEFNTMDGKSHILHSQWDLIIAHPPCTRLCSSGQRWYSFGDETYRVRKLLEREHAIKFFMAFVKANCDCIAIENPVGIMSTLYRKPDQIYNPFEFEGETECKKTCLWLKNLPCLKSTRMFPLQEEQKTHNIWKGIGSDGQHLSWNSEEVKAFRSKTPWGVAYAMAEQWG